jgi:hypothetical protein
MAVLLPPAALAQGPGASGGVERGRAIANTICWACHVVGPDQEFSPILRESGPDFRAIAKKSDVSLQSLTAFLRSTHGLVGKPYRMPNPGSPMR